jgi:hypothetical protein
LTGKIFIPLITVSIIVKWWASKIFDFLLFSRLSPPGDFKPVITYSRSEKCGRADFFSKKGHLTSIISSIDLD